MKCFVCETELKTPRKRELSCRGEDERLIPPSGGTDWQASGNYGSSVFDPCYDDVESLYIVICDKCLLEKKHLVIYFQRRIKESIENIKSLSDYITQEEDLYGEHKKE